MSARKAEGPALPRIVAGAMRRARLGAGATVIVAYSGGPDSTALLHALAELAEELRISVLPAHLDHALRPESERDAAYCRRVARRLGLAILAERLVDPPRDEQSLRELRYRFLAEQAAMVGAAAVATGHTLDDQAETVLLNLVRGSGSSGLGGMAASAEHHGVRVLRPMLSASRADVLAYLQARELRSLSDPSNLEPVFDRNRVRHRVMPLLEELRPGAARALARAAALLADESDYLARQARAALRRRGLPAAGIHRLHPALGRHVVRELVRTRRGDLLGLSQSMVDEALELSRLAAADGRKRHLALPGPWVLVATASGIDVVPGRRGRPDETPAAALRRHGRGR